YTSSGRLSQFDRLVCHRQHLAIGGYGPGVQSRPDNGNLPPSGCLSQRFFRVFEVQRQRCQHPTLASPMQMGGCEWLLRSLDGAQQSARGDIPEMDLAIGCCHQYPVTLIESALLNRIGRETSQFVLSLTGK